MGFLKIFDLVPSWLYALLLGLALIAGAAERDGKRDAQLALSQEKDRTAQVEAQRAKVAMDAIELKRELDALRLQNSQRISDAAREELRKTERAVAAGAATRRVLLDKTAAATASSGQGLRDPAALDRAEKRAATLGQLLGRCDAVAEGLGRNAEDLATQVRGLQRAYESLFVIVPSHPSSDGLQVDPGPAPIWNTVMLPSLPYASTDP